ncbi:MAG: hypothetical protein ACYCXW_18940 [Solirubrobacteraceae bacterium]
MSSLSRRQLARRRPGRLARSRLRVVTIGLLLVLACVAVLVIQRGGI